MLNRNKKEGEKVSLGKKIREQRMQKRITVRGFAEKLNVSASFINDIENGSKKPSLIQKENIIKILDFDDRAEVDELYSHPLIKNELPTEIKVGKDGKNSIVIALRISKELELNEKEWFEFLEQIKRMDVNDKNAQIHRLHSNEYA